MDVPSVSSVVIPILVVLVSRLLTSALVHLLWKPYAITKLFRGQGITGPKYRLFVGSLPEIKRMKAAAAADEVAAGAHSHDFIPIVLPQHSKWATDHGTYACFFRPVIPQLIKFIIISVCVVLLNYSVTFQSMSDVM